MTDLYDRSEQQIITKERNVYTRNERERGFYFFIITKK